MKIFLVVLFFMLQAFIVQAATFNHSDWDMLLKKHVVAVSGSQATRINYAGVAANSVQFEKYLTELSSVKRVEFDSWTKHQQLAFLINAYNAWTVELVLSAYPDIESIKDIGSVFSSPWSKEFFSLLDETRSLDNVEHDLIRGSGRYNEPRIHFAVNCASIGCPALRAEAYVAERLDTQLEDATRRFLSNRNQNRFEDDTLKVSSIFKWYRKDFKQGWRGLKTLNDFFAYYHQELKLNQNHIDRLKSESIDIEFLSYDWKLNKL